MSTASTIPASPVPASPIQGAVRPGTVRDRLRRASLGIRKMLRWSVGDFAGGWRGAACALAAFLVGMAVCMAWTHSRQRASEEEYRDNARRAINAAAYHDRMLSAVQGAAALLSLPPGSPVTTTSGIRPRLVIEQGRTPVSSNRDDTVVWGTAAGPLLELDRPAHTGDPWAMLTGEVSADRIVVRSRVPVNTCSGILMSTLPVAPGNGVSIALRVRGIGGDWQPIVPNALGLLTITPSESYRICDKEGAEVEWTVRRTRP